MSTPASRPQPLDGGTTPFAFVTNQIRLEGRGKRPVKENTAIAGLKAEMQKNTLKAAKAKATRQANLATMVSIQPHSDINQTALQLTGVAENGHAPGPGLAATAMASPAASRHTHQGMPGYQTHLPSQVPFPAVVSQRPMSLLEELNNPNLISHTTGDPLHLFATGQHNPAHQPIDNAQHHDHHTAGIPSFPANMDMNKEHAAGGLWNPNECVNTNTELEPYASGDDEMTPVGQGLNIQSRSVTLKHKRPRSDSHFNMDKLNNAAADDGDTEFNDASSTPRPTVDDSNTTIIRNSRSRSIRALAPDSQRIIGTACHLLRAHLSKVDPWPDAARPSGRSQLSMTGIDEYNNLAMEFWFDASVMLNITDIDPAGDELRRILERTSQFRGQVRDKACILIVHGYNFVDTRVVGTPLTKDQMMQITMQNRNRYLAIKDKFWYMDPTDVTIPNSMYRHPVIQHVFNSAWFGEGVFERYQYFVGDVELPLVTIAFILTAIENALDTWQTGRFKRVEFACKEYHRKYLKHLKRLESWKDFSAKEEIDLTHELQVSLLQNAHLSMPTQPDQQHDEGEETEADMIAMFAANHRIA